MCLAFMQRCAYLRNMNRTCKSVAIHIWSALYYRYLKMSFLG